MSAHLVFMGTGEQGRIEPLTRDRVRVGRDAHLELVIPPRSAEFVSRLHATLIREAGVWWVADENSTNGTYVNGVRIIRSRLAAGDVIQFGRGGPEARFDPGSDGATRVAPGSAANTVMALSGPPPRVKPVPAVGGSEGARESGYTRYVEEIVRRAMGEEEGRARRATRVSLATAVLAILAFGVWVLGSRVRDPDRRFARIANDLTPSVFLVQSGYVLGGEYLATGSGTGFAASEDGYIVTNKHVVQPELYDQSAACLHAALGRRGIDADGARVFTVWQGGTVFRNNRGSPTGDPGLGWSSRDGTLQLAAAAPNNLGRPRAVRCRDPFNGETFSAEWRPHVVSDNADIAVLRVPSRLRAIPLSDALPGPDEPVMAYGFPAGVQPLESNVAEPLRRTGRVLRVQETILIDTPVLQGNSGGPLVNLRGEVVGITTRGHRTSLQNNALRIEFARRQVERARALGGG